VYSDGENQSNIRVFGISGFLPDSKTVAKITDERKIIWAGPSSSDHSRYGIFLSQFKLAEKSITTEKMTSNDLFSSKVDFLHVEQIGQIFWIFGTEKTSSFAISICPQENDLESTALNSITYKLRCCEHNKCYNELKHGKFVEKNLFIGLFTDNQDNFVLCSLKIDENCNQKFPSSMTLLYKTSKSFQFSFQKAKNGVSIALVQSNQIQKLSLFNNTIVKNIDFSLDEIGTKGAKTLMGSAIHAGDLYVTSSAGVHRINFSACFRYGESKSVCLAIEDVLCGWNTLTNTCQEIRIKEKRGDDNEVIWGSNLPSEIDSDNEIEIERIGLKPVPISTITSGTVFDQLKWLYGNFQPIPQHDEKFSITFSPEFHRGQMVLYPAESDNLDGIYYLEYLIRGKVVRRSKFRVAPYVGWHQGEYYETLTEPVTQKTILDTSISSVVDESFATKFGNSNVWFVLLIIPIVLLLSLCVFQRQRKVSKSSPVSFFLIFLSMKNSK
jgi:hypothetical protein